MDAKILQSKKVDASEQKKKKTQTILLALLIPFFLYLIFSTFFLGKKSKVVKPPQPAPTVAAPPAAVPPPITPPPASAPAPGTSAPLAADVKPDENSWGPSPFSERGQKEEEEKVVEEKVVFVVQGIVYDPKGNSFAVINEKVVKKGDRIADNTVKDIKSGKVILESDDGEEQVLSN